jgi:hypothetical protein
LFSEKSRVQACEGSRFGERTGSGEVNENFRKNRRETVESSEITKMT